MDDGQVHQMSLQEHLHLQCGLSMFGDGDVVLRKKAFMQSMMRQNGVIEVLVGLPRLFCQKTKK